MNTINMKAYQRAYYLKRRAKEAARIGGKLCRECGVYTARKGRPRCSRCERAGAGSPDVIVKSRPLKLVPTGERIHDDYKFIVGPDGTPRPIPPDLLRRRFLSSAPGNSRWLIVWRVDNSIKSKAG